MIRIVALVEGQTEETFVREVLAPDLVRHDKDLRALLVGKPGKKGGIRPYQAIQKELLRLLRGDTTAFVTTMFDYYGLPQTFPGRATAGNETTAHARASHVESALLADLTAQMKSSWNPKHFAPYIQIHEFEAILFSDPERFAEGIGQPGLASRLASIRDAFPDPEHIDDGPNTAPAKRVKSLFPAYEKPLYGSLAALEIGMPTMLAACPHFSAWVAHLRALA